MKTVFELLNHDNTISVNRRLAHVLGLAESVIYAALLAKHEWYANRDRLEDGWFYSTIEDMEESTALSKFQQTRCIKNLLSHGLIRYEQRGVPARRYFYIVNDEALLSRLIASADKGTPASPEDVPADANGSDGSRSRNLTFSCQETELPEVKKLDNLKSRNLTSGCQETEQKTKVNKTKENKPELVNLDSARAQISSDRISREFGTGFAELAAEVVAEGTAGLFTIKIDGQTIDQDSVSSVYKKVEYKAVCHVADYISKKEGVRNLKAYLRTALFKAVREVAQKPTLRQKDYYAPMWDEPERNSYDEDVMAELREQYSKPAKPWERDYNASLW